MLLTIRLTVLILSFGLLGACTVPPDPDTTVSNTMPSSITDQSDVPTDSNLDAEEILPDAIADRVQAMLIEEIGETSTQIGRYSRETWTDGCLGLGGPAESCLAALTEGWQVEVIDTATGQSYFYRTNLNGDSIRRSTLEENLPPSVRDRIFQTVTDAGLANYDDLSVIAAEPRLWDGCYGLPPEDGVCTEVGILGWRAVVGDNNQSWVYHTDGNGTVIRLNDSESEGSVR